MRVDERHRAEGVFEGGGVKGIAFAGAIAAAERERTASRSTRPYRKIPRRLWAVPLLKAMPYLNSFGKALEQNEVAVAR